MIRHRSDYRPKACKSIDNNNKLSLPVLSLDMPAFNDHNDDGYKKLCNVVPYHLPLNVFHCFQIIIQLYFIYYYYSHVMAL